MYGVKTKVLIIDDDSISRMLLCNILQKGGFETVETDSTERARQILKEDREIDVLICDIMMPDEDGFSFLRKLREDPALDDKIVLLCSAKRDPETVRSASAAGVSGYIVKPFSADYILTTLRNLADALPPFLQHASSVTSTLGVGEEQAYDSFLAETDKVMEFLQDTSQPDYAQTALMYLSNIFVNASSLGLMKIKALAEQAILALKQDQAERVFRLIPKLERECHRLRDYQDRKRTKVPVSQEEPQETEEKAEAPQP